MSGSEMSRKYGYFNTTIVPNTIYCKYKCHSYQGNTYQPLRRSKAGCQSDRGIVQGLEMLLVQNDIVHSRVILENASLHYYTCIK